MSMFIKYRKCIFLSLMCLMMLFLLTACSDGRKIESALNDEAAEVGPERSQYIVTIDDEPDSVDFQCTTLYYTVGQIVFDRLVETEADANGDSRIQPSLAASWEISDDRCRYTFHLQKDVRFSNGSPLTSSDVLYTMTRLLTHPDSRNRDIVRIVKGADALIKGSVDHLEGFEILGDLDFAITLSEPFEGFLACLSMPGASIMDRETTESAGERFGKDPAWTIGTGPFILESWEPGKGMLFAANPDCWSGAPACSGLDLRFNEDSETARLMFEKGELDILDIDELANSAEYFIHGDIYQDRLYKVQQIGLTYFALNESIKPLDDVRVRKALQYGLNRMVLLDAAYSGRGLVENGIFPHGLYGYNPELAEIPYDPETARELLSQAGYPDGFDLVISVRSSATQWQVSLARLAASMWGKIGIRAAVEMIEENEFMRLRTSGKIACYAATWIADYDDPDNFINTFFGSQDNTVYRSLNYSNFDVMERVRAARCIADPVERIREYRELEEKIVGEEAAWIPLFSRQRYYVISERLRGFRAAWNGLVRNNYHEMSVTAEE